MTHESLNNFSPYIWNQGSTKIVINMCALDPMISKQELSNLLNELEAARVNFSIYMGRKIRILTYHRIGKRNKGDKKFSIIKQLTRKYNISESYDYDTVFIGNIVAIESYENTIVVKYPNNKSEYLLYMLLHSISEDIHENARTLFDWLMNLIKTKLFTIVFSQFYKMEKKQGLKPYWSLMLLLRSYNKDNVIKAKNALFSLSKQKSCCTFRFKPLTRKQVKDHIANFRLLVPLNRFPGELTQIFDVSSIIYTVIKNNSKLNENNDNHQEKVATLKTKMLPINDTLPNILTQRSKVLEQNNVSFFDQSSYSKNNIYPTVLELIPKPQKMPPSDVVEIIKNTLRGLFKTYGFKETVIFTDSFDIVLRKGSYYIFVKILQGIFCSKEAYKLISTLDAIAGLRDTFICIVVADAVEVTAKRILSEYGILVLLTPEINHQESLKYEIQRRLEVFP